MGKSLSFQTLAVLNVFHSSPTQWRYGLELIDELGIKGGTVYPILARMESKGWLVVKQEAVDPSKVGRPRRTLYRLTGEGQRVASAELARSRQLLGIGALGAATI